jgi:hypothetical protein
MKPRILDYDALTGTTTWHEYKPDTDETVITTVQDVEPHLELAKKMRNDDDFTKKGIKKEMWLYGSLPTIIIDKMRREDGVNVFEKGQEKEVIKLLNTKYAMFKTTRGHHA